MRPITFQTKVYELLEDYPQLEDILTEISPAFAKLKNPILRRTIARVTTIQQAAAVAGIEAGEVVRRLRIAAGLSDSDAGVNNTTGAALESEQPDWFLPEKVIVRYDAVKTLDAGDVPMAEILRLSNSLQEGQIFEFSSPFLPTPILDMLSAKGFKIWSKREGAIFFNRVTKS
ncbi:MAG: hypothetical protein CVU12_08265 [Bacteroidetes bacterium HGW-Bacteroidetes-7]|jgi:hypothetical protein|nr:MAG: hypothetical protein CVU12_08265 [Bacteroidetes bacterium HGW-Bacteroidetes-7]